MRRLTFICHAVTRSQREGRFPVPDEPILADGQPSGPYADLPGRFICAPERRAKETALLYAAEPQTAYALRDCDFGTWKGRALEEIRRDSPDGAAAWLTDPDARPHGGETFAELAHRVGEWLEGFPENGHVLAVTHAAVMRAAVLHVFGAPFAAFWRLDVQPLAALDLWFNGRSWTLRSLNVPAERGRLIEPSA